MVNTATIYRSPMRLVKHAFEETETHSAQAIARARKKLMAEIALSGDEILIDDVPYSRNDASTLLDGVTEDDWKVHNVIYAHKGLLDFLEKESFNDDELKKADAYLYNEKFVRAVSPFLAHSFNAVSGRFVREGDFETAHKLLNYGGYILPEHSGEAYQRIRIYLDDLLYTLRNLSWEKFIADEGILHFVFSDEWRKFLNKLPSSFTSLRDEVVEQLIAIVLRFQHKATWYYLHEVLVRLKGIETNEFNRSEVVRIDEHIYRNSQMEANRSKSSPASDSGGISGRAVWWVLWLILTIVRMATCNDRSSNSSHYLNDESFRELQNYQQRSGAGRINEQDNEGRLLHFLDSLDRSKSLLVKPAFSPAKTGDQPFGAFADLPSNNGLYTVGVTNNTPYDCVLLYFDGPSLTGSVYQGALSHTVAVYIQKGDTYRFNTLPGLGRLHFLFGEQWGQLKDGVELPVSNYNDYSTKQTIFVYEFFRNKKHIAQPYLHKGLRLERSTATTNDRSVYLNKPDNSAPMQVELLLTQGQSGFTVGAKGGLRVKEEEHNSAEAFYRDVEKRKAKLK